MRLDINGIVAHAATALANGKAAVMCHAHDFLAARKRRLEQDKQFYRNLRAYCRANNLSPVCEDDWKTATGDTDDDNPSMIHSKGYVPWTKANLPR